MSDLIQIGDMPPLRQSTIEMMACPRFYLEVFIKGRKMPSGLDSARGTQVHHVLAEYASWCAHKGVAQDTDAFDRFSKGVGPQAAKILSGLRESYVVDFEHLLATEVPMALDDSMNPTDITPVIEGVVLDSGLPAAFQGTMDAIYIYRPERKIRIDDAKTHPKPFEPDDKPQGKQYALFIFLHFPWAQEVTFRLVFVRYKNLVREITYTRENIATLIEAATSARARQQLIHDDYDAGREIQAIAGPHCTYCPMLSDRSCPIAEYNPAMQLTMEERVNYALWYAQFSRVNNAALKDYVQATGRKVVLKDFNGKAYVYGPVEREAKVYPLFKKGDDGLAKDERGNPELPIVDLLLDHAYAFPDDTKWFSNVVISSTSIEKYLGAKSRVLLDQAVKDSADTITKVTMKISKPLDALPPEDDLEDGEEEFEDVDF